MKSEISAHKKVSLIVLNWNGKNDTIECLKSIKKIDYPNLQVIVVDNASSDGSVEAIKKQFKDTSLIVNRRNLGFTGGNNVGIRYALKHGANYVFILNNDIIVDKDVVKELVRVAESDDRIGIVGPKVYSYHRPTTIDCVGGYFNWRRGGVFKPGYGKIDKGQFDEIRAVDFVPGGAMMVKSVAFERIGYFDPNFFMYYEEDDFLIRAKKLGYKIFYVPSARIWHKGLSSFKSPELKAFPWYYMLRNLLLFMLKYAHGKDLLFFLLLYFFKRIPAGIIGFVLREHYFPRKHVIKLFFSIVEITRRRKRITNIIPT